MSRQNRSLSVATKANQLTMVQVITDGLRTMLKEREEILVLGEDVGKNGGIFRATEQNIHLNGDFSIPFPFHFC